MAMIVENNPDGGEDKVILFTVGMRGELTRGAACSRCLAKHASAVSDRQRLPADCRI
jgi:hypothetical protein